MQIYRHRIEAADGWRVDRYIAVYLKLFTRSQLKQRVVRILINGAESKPGKKIHAGDDLEIQYRLPPPSAVLPESIPLAVLYEDENVIVINKPRGMIVHPAGAVTSGTLVNALLHHCESLREAFPADESSESDTPEAVRPGIVHRLDRDTSGVVIAAKNIRSREFLAAQFRNRTARKLYLAVVRGTPPEYRGRIETLLCRDPRHRKRFTWRCTRGKKAVTYYRVLRQYDGYALLALRPRTGRTHQLRVHCLSMGCPILGDRIYGRRDAGFPEAPMMLHAKTLRIHIPGGPGLFRAPLPDYFLEMLETLRKP